MRPAANKIVRLLAVGLLAAAVPLITAGMIYAVSFPLADLLDYESFVLQERQPHYRAFGKHLDECLLPESGTDIKRLCHQLPQDHPLESRLTQGLWSHYQAPMPKAQFQQRFMTRQPRPENNRKAGRPLP